MSFGPSLHSAMALSISISFFRFTISLSLLHFVLRKSFAIEAQGSLSHRSSPRALQQRQVAAANNNSTQNATTSQPEYRFISVIQDRYVAPIQIDPSTGAYIVQTMPSLHFSATASNTQIRIRLVTDLTKGNAFGEGVYGNLALEMMDFGPNNSTIVGIT